MRKLINNLRSFFYTNLAKYSMRDFKSDIKANGFTWLTRRTSLGNNVNFNGFRIYGTGKVSIGNNFHSGFGCKILNSYHNYDGESIPYDSSVIVKDVTIQDNVWLGINVLILGDVTIEEGAIIQAGSVVVNNIPKYAIAGGHPAKVFSYRNKVKYEKLKQEGKFF
tara:strand:+ start:250081 stop:250575 length:495 start_codon:yes stop_codon:yes gene_type:complete